MSRAAQIRFLSSVAALYDPTVRAMGFGRLWRRLAEVAKPRDGEGCLDVCTGTGGVALALAQHGAAVVGVDLARGMLARARSKAHRAGLADRARWLPMDASALAWPESSFAVTTCSMALHEMSGPERERTLGELRRVSADRVIVADYRVPPPGWRRRAFQTARVFEYLESDDFESFVAVDLGDRIEQAGLRVREVADEGSFRIWSCAAT